MIDVVREKLDQLKTVKVKREFYERQLLPSLVSEDRGLALKLEGVDKNLAIINLSKEFYLKAIDVIHRYSKTELETILNVALQNIFYDKRYSVKIELEDKRGKSLTFLLVDSTISDEEPIESDIRNEVGGGVRVVVSFIVQIFYILSKHAYPVILLDEPFTQISADYIDPFFAFIKALIQEKDMMVVIITHVDEFRHYANMSYRIQDGHIHLLP